MHICAGYGCFHDIGASNYKYDIRMKISNLLTEVNLGRDK